MTCVLLGLDLFEMCFILTGGCRRLKVDIGLSGVSQGYLCVVMVIINGL